ncbi:MAG TPA: trigger factor [Ktedonobacteraceae bacterium]|nr:trigger factor [Ktedonobacteraceae bacterium]
MKVSVETLPSSEAVVNVDFSWEELEKASDKAYRKLVQKVDIQGFRRGKAPRSLVERKLGKEYIYQEGLDDLMSETYREALKEHKIVPLTQPELDAPVLEMGQPYHFSIKVPILPPVELGDYRSLHFERPVAEVTSEEVEQELEKLRERQVRWEEVERPAQMRDRVTMDLKLSVEDATVSDLKENPFELTEERHGLFKGMDEQIVGMQKGESKTFSTTIPEDYANEKLAGKTANYEVRLHKVEFKNLPELDDAFAIQASNDEYQTIEDLRKAVSDQVLDNKKRKIRDELRDKVLQAVVDQAQMTIHPVLIEEEAHEMMHQMTHILEQQRMSMDQYLMLIKKSQAEYLESLKPDAEKRVRQQLVLDEIVKKEDIQVSPEEVESLLRLYAQMGQALPRTEQEVRSIASSLLREKAISRLLELTTDPDPDEEAVEQETKAEANEQEAPGQEAETDTSDEEAAKVEEGAKAAAVAAAEQESGSEEPVEATEDGA